MKKIFYLSILSFIIFEFFKVYFIMPFPGSQEINSIDFAYFLHKYRWVFRILLGSASIYYFIKLWKINHKILPLILILIAIIIIYLFNFKFSADAMFEKVVHLEFKTKITNQLDTSRLVLGIDYKGIAKAYPIEYLAYHHQVVDTISGQEIIVTYCSVCRSGRAYLSLVNGKSEEFRLVGMDHYNAMFEDKTTGSWWRQVNGEAITGKLKGMKLKPIFIRQMTVQKWFETYPNGTIMAPDKAFIETYDSLGLFEKGKNKSKLTGRDTGSWKPKSWVIGVEIDGKYKAYDWNELVRKRIINDVVNKKQIVIALAEDNICFVSFERNFNNIHTDSSNHLHLIQNDLDKAYLIDGGRIYTFYGKSILDSTIRLKPIPAYQEFWHSWKTFHPNTEVYR